jgi:hypothetical protein
MMIDPPLPILGLLAGITSANTTPALLHASSDPGNCREPARAERTFYHMV